MTRSSTRPPGSTLTTSGSSSVRSLARNASYFTSFKSGLAVAPSMLMAGGGAIVPRAPPLAFMSPACPAHCVHVAGTGSRLRGARHGRHAVAFLELLENLLRWREAEVRQHHDHFLFGRPVAVIVDDQGCGHQQLLLQSLVRVHPIGP